MGRQAGGFVYDRRFGCGVGLVHRYKRAGERVISCVLWAVQLRGGVGAALQAGVRTACYTVADDGVPSFFDSFFSV